MYHGIIRYDGDNDYWTRQGKVTKFRNFAIILSSIEMS